MKIEFNNLYTHFVFITLKRQPVIPEKSRIRIEKYITGIVKNNSSKLYAIYTNPEQMHILFKRKHRFGDSKSPKRCFLLKNMQYGRISEKEQNTDNTD